MEITDLITPRSVVAQLRAANKRQALQELAKRAAAMTGISERAVYDVLTERERLGTTGIGMGIGIPHGKLPGLTRMYGIFARLERPIPFEAIDDQPVDLTNKEYAILELLSLRKGTIVTRETFLDQLYGGMDEPELKTFDVFICKLRKKLARATGGRHYIETVWGHGYVLREGIPKSDAAKPKLRWADAAIRGGTAAALNTTAVVRTTSAP